MGFFDSLMKSITGTTKAAKKYSNPSTAYGGSTYTSQVPRAASRAQVPQSTYESQVPRAATASVPDSTIRSQVPTAGQPRLGVTPNPGQVAWEQANPGAGYFDSSGSTTGGTGGGGTSSGGGGSGGGGGGSIPTPAPPVPKPFVPPSKRPVEPVKPVEDAIDYDVLTVPDAMSDATYQAETAALQKVLEKYIEKDRMARGDYRSNFDSTLEDLGWDANDRGGKGDWQERGKGSFGNSFVANENDFGSRGASTSGIYADSQAKMRADYDNRMTDMIDAKTKWSANQDLQLEDFKDETQTGKDTARANAIARLAQKYGISGDMVGWDEGKSYSRRVDSGAKKDKSLSEWKPTTLSEKELDSQLSPAMKKYQEELEAWKRQAKNWDEHYADKIGK